MPGGSGPTHSQRPAPPQTLSFNSQEEQLKESLLMTSQVYIVYFSIWFISKKTINMYLRLEICVM